MHLLLTLLFLVSTTALSTTVVPLPARTVQVVGIVGPDTKDVPAQLIALASEPSDLPIYLYINSPGGGVLAGYQIVNALGVARERGVPIVCMVGQVAASMAFQLLAYCDERYALPNSLLLFHPVRTSFSGEVTPEVARTLYRELARVDNSLKLPQLTMMRIDSAAKRIWYNWHHNNETLFITTELNQQLGFQLFTLVDDIAGINIMETGERGKRMQTYFEQLRRSKP